MKITLNKALKLKNKLVKKIAVLGNRMQQVNSYNEKNPPAYNSRDVHKEYEFAIHSLVKLKVAINHANLGIVESIIRMGELKGMIAYVNQINTEAGEKPGYGSQASQTFIATISELEKDKMVEQYQAELEAHQDNIDKYNAITEIEVD